MKKRYLIITIILFLFRIPNTNASTCDNADILRVKGIANDITIEYVINEEYYKNNYFDVKITGLPEELYIKEETTGDTYKINLEENEMLEIPELKSGNYTFKIYYFKCNNKLIRTINLKIPKYNNYANHPLCKDITKEEVEECYEWYQGDLTEETLKEKIDEYNKELEMKKAEEEKNNTLFNRIKKILLNYYIYIIPAALIIIIITTMIIVNRKRNILE